MARYQVVKGELLYSNLEAGVTVRQGVIAPQNVPVAIKELVSADLAGANVVIREAVAMASLQHSGICQIYDCYIDQNELGQFLAVIVVERMESDLWAEIQRRRNYGQTWSDMEIVEALRQIVTALSFAQSQGIAHRDIKPQNIFVSGNVYKVGDFGSSNGRLNGDLATTIRGSPFFLSPELKTSFNQALQAVPYDPFKSDVYSLGLSVMCMAMLDAPREMNTLDNLENTTFTYIESLAGYMEVQNCLRSMLVIDPNRRPSFAEIQTYLDGQSQGSAFYPVYGYQQAAPAPVAYQPNPLYSSLPSSSPNTRICSICSQPIHSTTWVHSISRDLAEYQAFASDVCSEKCLRTYRNLSGSGSTKGQLSRSMKPMLNEASQKVLEAAEAKVPGSSELLKQAASFAKSLFD